MSAHAVEATLREIFATVLGLTAADIVDSLSPDTCSRWDSLHHVHLINAIDETFGIELSVEQQVEMMNFDLAVEVVREAL